MCTNFKHRPAQDGSVVVGRTMEFPKGIPWHLSVLPKGETFTALFPGGRSWTSSHGIVGISAVTGQAVVDGMNDAGVSGHVLYMQDFCTYAEPRHDGTDLCEVDVVAFLLGTCSSVQEIKAAAADLHIVGVDPGVGWVPPVHVLFHDSSDSIVLELRPEGLSVVDNPSGVGTNAPFLDWHLTNLRNYVGISPDNPEATVDGTTYSPLGQGGGLRGLPGDYTPPARFVRAFVQVQFAAAVADGREAEYSTLHILNSLDINKGLLHDSGFGDGMDLYGVTEWSTISNLTDLRYSYRTLNDPRVHVVDLAATDFSTARSRPLAEDDLAPFSPVVL
jgi:choloylglycine hydrolase